MTSIKIVKKFLFLVGIICVFTSCAGVDVNKTKQESVTSDLESDVNNVETDNSNQNSETPTPLKNTMETETIDTDLSTQYGFFESKTNPYKAYINSLKYLEEIEAKILLATTTKDMAETRINAYNAWDKELNKIYALLMEKLSEEDANKLKAEERLWIKEKEFNAAEVNKNGGAMAPVDSNDYLFYETKIRTLELVYNYFSENIDSNEAVQAYEAIIQNKAKFFSVIDNKDVYLKDYFKEMYVEMYPDSNPTFVDILAELCFTIVDLDGDGTNEVILSMSSYGDFMLILHYDNGTVYGYGPFGIRQIGNIKKDGSFSWSGGAGFNGYSKIDFYGIVYKYTVLASHDEKYDENGKFIKSITLINNEAVTESQYIEFDKKQQQKENIAWRPFDENDDGSSIKRYLSTPLTQDKTKASETLKLVLQNKEKFYSAFEEKYVYFNQSQYVKDIPFDEPFSALEFTIVNMDGDGINEIVITANDSDRNVTEVLHYENGIVYSYGFGLRDMYYLKTDGSFTWTEGAQNSGSSKLQFLGVSYENIELESYEDIYDDKGNIVETMYFIDKSPVTKEDYEQFTNKRSELKDVVWYDFNDVNISSKIN